MVVDLGALARIHKPVASTAPARLDFWKVSLLRLTGIWLLTVTGVPGLQSEMVELAITCGLDGCLAPHYNIKNAGDISY
jgi:hypothetical protein